MMQHCDIDIWYEKKNIITQYQLNLNHPHTCCVINSAYSKNIGIFKYNTKHQNNICVHIYGKY